MNSDDGKSSEYRFSRALDAHGSAVKCFDVDALGCLLATGSTDATVNLWKTTPEKLDLFLWTAPGNNEYVSSESAVNLESFVNSLAFYAPDASQPPSHLFVGTLKCDLVVFVIEAGTYKLTKLRAIKKAHKGNVCALSVDVVEGRLLTGSWDHTAAVWSVAQLIDPVLTDTPPSAEHKLVGHEQAVWTVVSVKGQAMHYLTGSADRTIKFWHQANCLRTFQPAEGCVRSLYSVSNGRVFSVGNDCQLYEWHLDTGHALNKVTCHVDSTKETYLYCLDMSSVDSEGVVQLLVTGDEGGVITLYSVTRTSDSAASELTRIQQLHVPAAAIWDVRILPNNDIACAASDGKIWFFTLDGGRAASPDRLGAYDAHIASKFQQIDRHSVEAKSTTITVVLENQGGNDGAMKLTYNHGEDPWQCAERFIRENHVPEHHLATVWALLIANYVVENVPAAKNYTPNTRGQKQTFEGVEYDYVFELSVDDGRDLKLPYNTNETPDAAAERFMAHNKLPIGFTPMVSNFIKQQMATVNDSAVTTGGYEDPFTGGNRYVPGQAATFNSNGVGGGADPLTGGGRYVPGSANGFQSNGSGGAADPYTGSGGYRPGAAAAHLDANQQSKDKTRPLGENVPLKNYIRFDHTGVTPKAVQKLRENNQLLSEEQRLGDDQLLALEKMMLDASSGVSEVHLAALHTALHWPLEYLAPALDAFRLALLNRLAVLYFFKEDQDRMVNTLERLECILVSGCDVAVRVFVCRALTNAVAHPAGRASLTDSIVTFTPLVMPSIQAKQTILQTAAVSCMANFSLVMLQRSEQDKVHEVSIRDEFMRSVMNELMKIDSFSALAQPTLLTVLQVLVTVLWGDRACIHTAIGLQLQQLIASIKDATQTEQHKIIARDIQFMIDAVAA